MIHLSGKETAHKIKEEIKKTLSFKTITPQLAVVVVGNNPASLSYISSKTKACKEIGIRTIDLRLPLKTTEKELLGHIDKLNDDEDVDGILVQVPLPKHIDENCIVESITPEKDVDGFHPTNLGKLLLGLDSGFIPCTPLGIKLLLDHFHIPIQGKNVVILGRSHIVGKPLANLLMQKKAGYNATVTVCHSKTQDLQLFTKKADILIAAIGSAQLVKEDMVKQGAVVIDVGNNRLEDPRAPKGYRMVGDVDFKRVAPKCSAITPVPGGVGPMTVACLLHNTFQSFLKRRHA